MGWGNFTTYPRYHCTYPRYHCTYTGTFDRARETRVHIGDTLEKHCEHHVRYSSGRATHLIHSRAMSQPLPSTLLDTKQPEPQPQPQPLPSVSASDDDDDDEMMPSWILIGGGGGGGGLGKVTAFKEKLTSLFGSKRGKAESQQQPSKDAEGNSEAGQQQFKLSETKFAKALMKKAADKLLPPGAASGSAANAELREKVLDDRRAFELSASVWIAEIKRQAKILTWYMEHSNSPVEMAIGIFMFACVYVLGWTRGFNWAMESATDANSFRATGILWALISSMGFMWCTIFVIICALIIIDDILVLLIAKPIGSFFGSVMSKVADEPIPRSVRTAFAWIVNPKILLCIALSFVITFVFAVVYITYLDLRKLSEIKNQRTTAVRNIFLFNMFILIALIVGQFWMFAYWKK